MKKRILNKKSKQKQKTIRQYVNSLNDSDKILLKEYINHNYTPKVRTGNGKINNFYKEHDSPGGIQIVKEILKFKRIENF